MSLEAAKTNFRTYTVGLVAGVESTINVTGNMYAVIENTGEFTITFDESNALKKQTAGMGAVFAQYQEVRLLSPTTQSVTLVLGYGEFDDSRANVAATFNVTIEPSDTMSNPGDVSVGVAATLLVAANADRKEVIISVPSTEPDPIRIGSASVTTTSGDIVEPGSKLILSTESAVYGIRTGSTDITATVLDLTRP